MTDALRERIEKGKQWLAGVQNESPEQLLERLATYRQALDSELAGLSEAQFAWKPAPDQWSIKETCLHISHSSRSIAGMVEAIADGGAGPAEIRMGLLDDDCGSQDRVRGGIDEAFQGMADLTTRLEHPFDEGNRVPHPYFGPLNGKGWVVFNLMHTGVHIAQIKRIKTSPRYPV